MNEHRWWSVGAAFVAAGVTLTSAAAQPRQYRGDATVTVRFANPTDVEGLCAMIGAPNSAACANDQIMIVPNPCRYHGYYAEILCHELGHVNGWPPDHPTRG